MSDDVDLFVRSLARLTDHDYREHSRQIEDMAHTGRVDELVHIAKILAAGEPSVHEWDRENVFDHILGALTMSPGLANAAATLTLIEVSPTARGNRLRRDRARQAASMLAQAQPMEVFLALVGRDTAMSQPRRDALACWAQEHVVRGTDLTTHAHVVEFWRTLAVTAHPLSKLPLAPLRHENDLASMVPRYAGGSSATSLPFGPSDRPKIALPRDTGLPFASRSPDAPFATAVADWNRESNGIFEENIFISDRPIDAFDASVLARMGLACLEDATSVSLQPLDTATALAMLFSAAANGGAYNRGGGGGYGRLDAWTSLAGLALGVVASDFPAVAERVASASFVAFDSDSAWFHAVAWDMAIACVRQDRATIAAFAATDTD